MNNIEILSPARNMEAVIAAVRTGCDAVYVGAKKFSARMAADNFDMIELKNCIDYCHEHKVKVYLAINTLIFDEEMQEALQIAQEAYLLGIDALIVQDLGFAYALTKLNKDIRLHASTQMSVHNKEGVKFLKAFGFKRVVLSRELSLSEIKKIHEECKDIELEVFVHGALCMSVSGQCYFSSVLGGRSANRGMCAQPCRLPFSVDGLGSNALSLKDNSVIDKLDLLYQNGVTSAKIEGRMKRPEYVGISTFACNEMKSEGTLHSDTKRNLENVFQRSGFTDGYLTGKIDKTMFGIREKDDVLKANNDLFKEIHKIYKDEIKKEVVDFEFFAKLNKKAVLVCNGLEVETEVICEKANNQQLTIEKVEENLRKTGNTIYTVRNVKIEMDEGISLPIASINKLRRQIINILNEKNKKIENRKRFSIDNVMSLISDNNKRKNITKKIAVVKNLEIPDSFSNMDVVFVDIFQLNDYEKIKKLQSNGIEIGINMPRAIFEDEEIIEEKIEKLRDLNIEKILIHNVSEITMSKKYGYEMYGSFALNITNSFSLLFLKEIGFTHCEVSLELDLKRFDKLVRFIDVGIQVYSYLPLMLTRNCPVRGVGIDCKSCKKDKFLQDRKNVKFRVLCNKEYREILNAVPLILSQEIYKDYQPDFVTFCFYVENSVENKDKIYHKIAKNLDFDMFTKGLLVRGVK